MLNIRKYAVCRAAPVKVRAYSSVCKGTETAGALAERLPEQFGSLSSDKKESRGISPRLLFVPSQQVVG